MSRSYCECGRVGCEGECWKNQIYCPHCQAEYSACEFEEFQDEFGSYYNGIEEELLCRKCYIVFIARLSLKFETREK